MAELKPEQQAKILQRKVTSLYKEMQAIYESAKEAEKDDSKFSAFRGRYMELNNLHKDFIKYWEELYVHYVVAEKEKDFPFEEKYLKGARTFVYECNALYESIMNPTPEKGTTSARASVLDTNIAHDISQNVSMGTAIRSRLPKLNIPEFDGDLFDWPKFRDLYLTLVHDETCLAKIEKFHYLIATLSGEPLRLVTSFSITDANYDSAWKALMDRYNNKRILAAAYFQKIRQFKLSSTSATDANRLRSFLSDVADNFTALNALGIPDEADYFKLQLALDCLDPDIRKSFEERQHGQEFPKYESLVSFIQQRCQILELSESQLPSRLNRNSRSSTIKPKGVTAFVQKDSQFKKSSHPSCPYCKGEHFLFKCFSFKSLQSDQRFKFVRSNNLCINCLRQGHYISKCKSKSTCYHCRSKHHSLLHEFTPPANTSNSEDCQVKATTQGNEDTQSKGLIAATSGTHAALLGTAMVHMFDWSGNWQPVRMVIDSGSQFSIITADCARRLGLPRSPAKHAVWGIGHTPLPQAKGMIHCKLQSTRHGRGTVETRALVMPSLFMDLPTSPLPRTLLYDFRSIELADEKFWESRPVEFLLGVDLFFQILTSEPKIQISKALGTLPTIFGHVVLGIAPTSSQQTTSNCLAIIEEPISDDILKKFWEVEDIETKHIHPDDQKIEEHYTEHVRRLPTGRYMVALPLINPHLNYPVSRPLAFSRFQKLEARFNKEPHLKELYFDFMKEYLELGHMSHATSPPKFVIPHHAILKMVDVGKPPKLRVVFDASMNTPQGSLNDNLLPGPKLQQNINTILINFRTHRFVFCTDIVKMFRQILIIPEHRPFQTIAWRFSAEEAVQIYELNTLTYGEKSSPYLAIRTIKRLVEDEGKHYPMASEILMRDIYVDDIISGGDSQDDVLEMKNQIIELLGKGCFPVHKWASNCPDVLTSSTNNALDVFVSLPPEDTSVAKILGMQWDSTLDIFSYTLSRFSDPSIRATKRTLLSVVARLYDPLGLLAPVILLAKSIIQELWSLKIDWDEPLPPRIMNIWNSFMQDLPSVNKILIPRWVRSNVGISKLLGFCDASEKGYAACLYLRIEEPQSKVSTFLLTAKTKLAPVNSLSIPRLELCAAHLLIRLLNSLRGTLLEPSTVNNPLLFTDSTIVLSWLRLHPQQLKTFVANRVGYILENSKLEQWNHVPSSENPADIASRGTLASTLNSNELWWNGPEWMRQSLMELPRMPHVFVEDIPEKRVVAVCMSPEPKNFIISHIEGHSNYPLMVRSLAYVSRFVGILLQRHGHILHTSKGPLSAAEVQEAFYILIKCVQRRHFAAEFNYCSGECKSSRFQALNVFLDSSGLLRVGGRLAHAALSYDRKHPIVLPHDSKLTIMMIDHYHQRYFHMGAKALQAYFQRGFHIFKLRSLVRKRIWNCVRCFKSTARPTNPLMADLPASRVSQGRPFISVGVDFAGPYAIKLSQRRNAGTTKAYMCLFVCMSVKAVHLELVSSLSTEAFLGAFDRFVARRGLPTNIYSDCGTNFIGAARHLRELYQWFNKTNTQHIVSQRSSILGINWHFNPPSAPHFGGLWEAAVKSAKSLLRKTLGDRPFYFEELSTIFARIEAILNSRPLCSLTSSPNEFDFLSPGHFLIGAPLIASPEYDLSEIDMSRLRRWQLIQASAQIFWRRWSNEYVHLLQSRTKWTRPTDSLKIGDLVLIQDPSTRPLNWQIGRITCVYPDHRGTVRIASVKTSNGEFKRPVHRLAPLDPINSKE